MENVRILALGGLDEDGKNMLVIEINDNIFIVECGLKYPEGDQLGIEMIIPDFRYLVENKHKIKGIFITHGHDDVVGALPKLLDVVNAPIYTAPLTALMIEKLLRDLGKKVPEIHRVQRNSTIKVAGTTIKIFGMTMSIADGFGLAIKTSQGYVVYSSEYIIDYDIRNEAFKCDLANFIDLANEGVLALITESVAATREGHSAPNHRITNIIEPVFEGHEGRILISTYSQNLYRFIEICELAHKYGRKIYIYDDNLKAYSQDLAKLGYYHMPTGLEIPTSRFSNNNDNAVIVIAGAGSTIFKKINKIAAEEDETIRLRPEDTFIIASPAVPGTEREASRMQDDLYKKGCKVITIDYKRSFSMHAAVEDLKMLIYLLKPKYYLPFKGDYYKLVANANIALNMGFYATNIIVMDNGQIATITDGQLKRSFDSIEIEDVMVDGKENLDSSGMVLRDRELLSTDGVIVVGIVINHKTKEVIGGPDVQSRGVIYLKDADYLIKEIGIIMEDTINEMVANGEYENMAARQEARDRIIRYVLKETKKRPMILPAIVEINTAE
ncbi:MAG: ribonuclease J [Erysipelotrichaceae bacterium]|nr:ribonuclease J [Erysipelotrichaceae bacterium]